MRWVLLLLALSGCGFQPVFAPSAVGRDAAPELAAVEVALVPERSGQIIRQDVQQRLESFGTGTAKRYRLTIGFSFAEDLAGIQPDSSATFVRVRASANWRLTLLNPGATLVTSGTARAIDGFNEIDEQVFASTLETESVENLLAERLADEIALQLGLYFKQHGPSQAPA